MSKALYSLFALLLLLAPACGKSSVSKSDSDSAAASSALELPLPSIPADLTTPEARADYLALHFWDAMDWRDPARALDTAFVEQNFANFLSGLPYTTPDGLAKAVPAILDKVRAAGAPQFDLFYSTAAKYLYQGDSPMRDEQLFLPFVDWAIAHDYDADRARMNRADILRNRPGTVAADFSFDLREGGTSTLGAARGVPVLLMFYEPDCENCKQVEKQLAASQGLHDALRRGDLRFIAVYVGDNRNLWQSHAKTLPADWTVGIDADMTVDNDDLYTIPATPTFYLIDSEGKVLLKDPPLPRLAQTLRL